MRLRHRRSEQTGLPKLPPAPRVRQLPPSTLQSAGRYLGTSTGDGTPVTDQGLSVGGGVRISLSDEGLDVIRLAGAFRIPLDALRSARAVREYAGKPVTPDGAVVIRWAYGDQVLDSGFTLEPPRSIKSVRNPTVRSTQETYRDWVRAIGKIARNTDTDTNTT